MSKKSTRKHLVSCVQCGRQFDANWGYRYDPASRRYTCPSCVNAERRQQKRWQAEERLRRTGMKQTKGGMVAKIVFGAFISYLAFDVMRSDGIYSFTLFLFFIGVALILSGIIPYLKAKGVSARDVLKGNRGLEAESADLISKCQELTQTVNTCDEIGVFADSWNSLMACTDRLIYLNEKKGIPMTPPPRLTKEKFNSSRVSEINKFMERAAQKIQREDAAGDDVEAIVRFTSGLFKKDGETYRNQAFLNLMTTENIDYGQAMLDKAKAKLEEKIRTAAQPPTETPKKTSWISSEYEQAIIRDEENWRREMRGLTSAEKIPKSKEPGLCTPQRKSLYGTLAFEMGCYDPEELEEFPYDLNCQIQNTTNYDSNRPDKFSFCIELNEENVKVAISDIKKLDCLVRTSPTLSPIIPSDIHILIDKIEFRQYGESRGYSKLFCYPYTYRNDISDMPFKLVFMTKYEYGIDSSDGDIWYYVSGEIHHATVGIWKNGRLYIYDIRNRSDELYIYKIETSMSNDGRISQYAIYEDEQIIKEREFQRKEHEAYDWIQENLPDLCPKSYSAYRRMKKQNTKNYQKIVAAARESGREIE